MTQVIPMTVAARDEAASLGACLDSYLAAIAVTQQRLDVRVELLVVLDDTSDGSPGVCASRGVPSRRSSGGKLAAQLAGVRPGPFQLFGDADVLVEPETIAAMCELMLDDPSVAVAFPDKLPLPPRRSTLLARALHAYNRTRGYSSERAWFSGKLFAIRELSVPGVAELARRAATLPASRFHDYAAPLRIDDIYLSRRVTHDHGREAMRETAGIVWFRAPETWPGMYRYYRRMRRELERIDRLFPELGDRAVRIPDRLAAAPIGERALYRVFTTALAACKLAYRIDQLATDHLGLAPRDSWPAIVETKLGPARTEPTERTEPTARTERTARTARTERPWRS